MKPILLLLVATVSYSSTLSGSGYADWSTPDGGFTLNLTDGVGDAVFIQASSVTPALIGCSFCEFTASTQFGAAYGWASIAGVSSSNFSVSLRGNGELDGSLWIGNEKLPITTFLTGEDTVRGNPAYDGERTSFTFSAVDPPAVITDTAAPEPSYGIILALLAAAALYTRRSVSRPCPTSANAKSNAEPLMSRS